MFVEQTHELPADPEGSDKPMRYTDTRVDEQERGISLKMMPMSLVMESSASKSYLFNIMDTPGTACLCFALTAHLCSAYQQFTPSSASCMSRLLSYCLSVL